MLTRLFLSAFLLLASFAQAADVTPAPAVRKAFVLPLSDGTSVQAVFLPGANGTTLIVWSYQGRIVSGSLVVDGEVKPAPNPTPTPVPPPDPTPNPTPDPFPPTPPEIVAGVLIVHETKTDTPEHGRAITSKAVRDYCDAKGWKLKVFDPDVTNEKNEPVAALKYWVSRAKSSQYFFIIGKSGAVLQEGSLPSESNLLGILKKLGG